MENTTKDILDIINANAYKLYLYNKELNAISSLKNNEELKIYTSNKFLVRSIDAIHINFCILVSILINKNEYYSISKVVDRIEDRYLKNAILEKIDSDEFKESYEKIKILRNKCYAHNDKDTKTLTSEIIIAQNDRNIVCNGIIASVKLMCEKLLEMDNVSFDINKEAEIITQIRVIKEWRELKTQEAINKIKMLK